MDGNAIAGVVSIVIGVITILVSLALFGGSRGARAAVTVVFLLKIAVSIYAIVAVTASFWSAVWSAVLPTTGIVILYTGRANAFFTRMM